MNHKKGFTIMELLIVVAIIAILASIILVATGTARGKGGDAGVKANLQTVRSQSGVFFGDNSNSFLPAGGSTFAIATCPAYSATGTNMLSRDKTIADSIARATSNGGNGNSCYNSAGAWAVAVGLKTSATQSWCVDSGGQSKQVNTAPGSAIHATNFTCN
jgi:type IV pilus assembly protein PilA